MDAEQKTRALKGCVARMKNMALTGKARDDAAKHYFAGVADVLGLPREGIMPGSYTDVLEALASDD